jgi:crotonobetainyl-CoA:carnitine CoA-transferase CaiB-like acyl-CoA transferase
VVLTITTDAEWERFCVVSARLDLLADGRFSSVEGRRTHDAELAAVLEDMFATRTGAEWEASLAASGVACVQADEFAPGEFAAHNEHLSENGFVPVVHHARFGEMRRWGPIVQVNGGTGKYGPGVLGGANTDALLAEIGYTTDEIATLRAARAVASEDTAVFAG